MRAASKFSQRVTRWCRRPACSTFTPKPQSPRSMDCPPLAANYCSENNRFKKQSPINGDEFTRRSQPCTAPSPAIENGTVVDVNRGLLPHQPRSYLTEAEVEWLMQAVRKHSRYGHRGSAMILVAYRHGLRVGELVQLQWSQVHFESATLAVQRLKHGKPSAHPCSGVELRALRRLRREQPAGTRFVFVSERDAPMTTRGFAQMLSRAAERIAFPIAVHPHMLRHACGYKLANDRQDTRAIQDYLGHRNIQHTVKYTELASGRFVNFWRD